MAKIPMQSRRKINGILTELETLVKNGEFGEVVPKIKPLISMLEFFKVNPISKYYARIEKIETKIKRNSQKVKHQSGSSNNLDLKDVKSLNFEDGKHDYVGMSGSSRVRITRVYDHMFLSRIYQRTMKLSWRFNKEGRLDLVDAMLFQKNNKIVNLINMRGYGGNDLNWIESEAKLTKLPIETGVLNPNFATIKYVQQYESLMRFGHKMSAALLNNLNSKNIRDAHKIFENQKQLKEILNDDSTIYILENAANIVPFVKEFSVEKMLVEYVG
ncbi:hypothetical protein HON01_00745 [Candidatus Woesearchaeota archaeon]|nr:hypothetical protein [Candidatus Woesearchaeota archaeon]